MSATVPGQRRPSAQCETFIKGFEKCRLKAFLPTPNDKPTIGWGATGPDVQLGMTCSQSWADCRFARDLAAFGAGVDHALGAAPTTQGQFDALVSFAYNEGVGALAGSTLMRLHKAKDYSGASGEFAKWNKQHDHTGKLEVVNGLIERRAAEAAMYRGDA